MATLKSRKPRRRTTRFVCISDTHNTLPKLPRGDVLVHAGDLTNQGSFAELQRTVQWIERADFESKIVVAGNHDVTLDGEFYREHGSRFHTNQQLQRSSQDCMALLTQSPSITYLNHEARTICLTRADGPQTTWKVFGSPYSPSRGLWGFGYAPEKAVALWDDIPVDTDVLITHTPPHLHCDESPTRGAAGCEALRQALGRVQPRLAVCGHVHEGRGVETVLWDLQSPVGGKYRERETFAWHDWTIGTKKQWRIDVPMSSRAIYGNAGEMTNASQAGDLHRATRRENEPANKGACGLDGDEVEAADQSYCDRPQPQTRAQMSLASIRSDQGPIPPTTFTPPFSPEVRDEGEQVDLALRTLESSSGGRRSPTATCIVNASILGSSWPHAAGKKFNRPIVVDVELPVNDEE